MQKQINIDLKLLYKWLFANKISLNCSKTELIVFHKPEQPINNFTYKIKMNGHKLQPTEYIKYLGIYLDETLSGKHHCELLKKKLNRANGMLSKIHYYVPKEELKSIYFAIFSTHTWRMDARSGARIQSTQDIYQTYKTKQYTS